MRRILGLTDYAFADISKKGKFHEEAPMKETIKSNLELLVSERVGYEHMARFSLVAGICDYYIWFICKRYC